MKNYVCIEIVGTGARKKIMAPVWIKQNRNGLLCTSHRHQARGIGDGEQIWSLGTLAGYPEAQIITLAEYLEAAAASDEDPELTEGQIVSILLGGSYETA